MDPAPHAPRRAAADITNILAAFLFILDGPAKKKLGHRFGGPATSLLSRHVRQGAVPYRPVAHPPTDPTYLVPPPIPFASPFVAQSVVTKPPTSAIEIPPPVESVTLLLES